MENAKTLLVIGNGFDLACSLPTKYTDFLDYYNKNAPAINQEYYSSLDIIKCNLWIDYYNMMLKSKSIGEKWVDFEREMSSVISLIDKYTTNLDNTLEFTKSIIKNNKDALLFDYLKYNNIMDSILNNTMQNESMLFVRNKLYKDLEVLITVFETYLTLVVENMPITPNPIFDDIKPDYIVSFNYTHTINEVFHDLKEENICFIHGKCQKNGKYTNMVLGIDEYWGDNEKNIHTNFAIFKKFVQRIMKKTDAVINITELIMKDCEQKSKFGSQYEDIDVVFYGHSMDISDKDILLKLFELSDIYKGRINYKIYCYDKASQGQCIANLINIIGQNKLI